jgi:hypothetical protein
LATSPPTVWSTALSGAGFRVDLQTNRRKRSFRLSQANLVSRENIAHETPLLIGIGPVFAVEECAGPGYDPKWPT